MIWIMGETDKNLKGNASIYSHFWSLSAETWVSLFSSIPFFLIFYKGHVVFTFAMTINILKDLHVFSHLIAFLTLLALAYFCCSSWKSSNSHFSNHLCPSRSHMAQFQPWDVSRSLSPVFAPFSFFLPRLQTQWASGALAAIWEPSRKGRENHMLG